MARRRSGVAAALLVLGTAFAQDAPDALEERFRARIEAFVMQLDAADLPEVHDRKAFATCVADVLSALPKAMKRRIAAAPDLDAVQDLLIEAASANGHELDRIVTERCFAETIVTHAGSPASAGTEGPEHRFHERAPGG